MSTTEMTVDEMTESLTGFDEIAINKHMEMDIYLDGDTKPMMLMRSLAFVHQRRQGLTDPEAKNAALSLTVKDLDSYFAEAPEELDDEGDLDTPSGNDDSEPEPTLDGSRTSAS